MVITDPPVGESSSFAFSESKAKENLALPLDKHLGEFPCGDTLFDTARNAIRDVVFVGIDACTARLSFVELHGDSDTHDVGQPSSTIVEISSGLLLHPIE